MIEKSEEEKEAIRRVIRHNVLFKHLDREQFDEVVSAMSRREVPAGVNVVTQGASLVILLFLGLTCRFRVVGKRERDVCHPRR